MAGDFSAVPYVLLVFDLLFCYAVCHQYSTRFRVKKSFFFLEYVTTHVFHPKKDGYRAVTAAIILLKCIENVFWIARQWNIESVISSIWLNISWINFGLITCLSQIVICDFASLLRELEWSIVNNQHLSFDSKRCCYITPIAYCLCFKLSLKWKFLFYFCGIISSILICCGVFFTLIKHEILYIDMFGIASGVFEIFVSVNLMKSILRVTRETENTASNVRPSISNEEYQRQVIGLFQMKQIAFSLLFLTAYPIFTGVYYILSILVKCLLSYSKTYTNHILLLYWFTFYNHRFFATGHMDSCTYYNRLPSKRRLVMFVFNVLFFLIRCVFGLFAMFVMFGVCDLFVGKYNIDMEEWVSIIE